MTGLQDHPATGRTLKGEPTHQLSLEDVCRAIGVDDVTVFESQPGQKDHFRELLRAKLAQEKPCVLIVRRECLLAARRRKQASQTVEQEGVTCQPSE